MGWAFLGRLIVLVHTREHPDDPHWRQYLAELERQPAMMNRRVLVYSAGGGPSERQRKDLRDTIASTRNGGGRTAIVTPSRVMRGIGTALAWLLPSVKMFAPAYLAHAFDHLGLDAIERHEVMAALEALGDVLGVEIVRSPEFDA